MIKKVLITTFLFLLCSNLSFAENNVFPFPKGKVYVTNGYGGSDTHQNNSFYSLDFRAYETQNRCDSYGAPILASKDGIVIEAINPSEDIIKKNYGVHVYIKNDDDSISRYGHMINGSLAVKKDDIVKQGQILGLLGATGNTAGMECQNFDGINNGAHLHFETRDKDNKAKNPEPIIGKENYTNMSIEDSPYISTTLMYDPNNQWGKYKNKVPYRLTYSSSSINSFSPLIVQAKTNQIFTIKGENLFDDLSVVLSGCKKIEWIKRGADEQRFSCDITDINGLILGFIKFSSSGKPDFQFAVEVTKDKKEDNPYITKAEAINPLAGKLTDFTIEGQNLPDDLQFDLNTCKEVAYKKITPTQREFSCFLPNTIKDINGVRINGLYTFNTGFSSESKKFTHTIQFSADYEVRVDKIEPLIALSGIKNTFTLTGKNLNLAKAIWIEKCDNLREIERSDNKITIECVPRSADGLLDYFVPNFLKKNFYKITLKDEPNGTTIFESKILIIPFNKTKEIADKNKKNPKDIGGDIEDVTGENRDKVFYSEYDSIKNGCLNVSNTFESSEVIEKGNSITFKDDLVPMMREGFVKNKESIALFIKKTDIKSLKNILSAEKNINGINLYKMMVSRLNLDKIDMSVNGYDVTYYISSKKMKDMLKNGYCFISFIENDTSSIQKLYSNIDYSKQLSFPNIDDSALVTITTGELSIKLPPLLGGTGMFFNK
jgi:hypothetical protein